MWQANQRPWSKCASVQPFTSLSSCCLCIFVSKADFIWVSCSYCPHNRQKTRHQELDNGGNEFVLLVLKKSWKSWPCRASLVSLPPTVAPSAGFFLRMMRTFKRFNKCVTDRRELLFRVWHQRNLLAISTILVMNSSLSLATCLSCGKPTKNSSNTPSFSDISDNWVKLQTGRTKTAWESHPIFKTIFL